MKKPIIAILVAAGIMAAFAETKTNTSAPGGVKEKKYPWKSSVSAGLTLTRGNTSTTLFTASFLTERKTLADEYGTQNSKDSVNNYKVFGQWNHLFTKKFYSYVRAEGLQDKIANLDYRLTVGPGVGYYLIKETNTLLAAEAGAGFEAQRLGGKDENFATVRLAERFEHKFNQHARLWQSVEIMPQVDRFDNYVVNFEIGIETAITKSFSLKTYLVDTYANRPAVGRQKNDMKIVAAVAYKF